jgi:uncharacterized protein YegL
MAKRKVKKTTTTTVVKEEVVTDQTTEIISILDRSGSMNSIIDDSIGGYNSFIETQKESGEDCKITTILFDDQYEVVDESIDLEEVKPITRAVWQPRGTTALYDAIGKAINTIRANRSNMSVDDIPTKTLVVIVTDGYENASKEYSSDSIKQLVDECKEDDWQFIFLAANQDAFEVGSRFGMSAGNSFTYNATSDGARDVFAVAASAAAYYTTLDVNSDSFDVDSANLISNTNVDDGD